jgi:integrase
MKLNAYLSRSRHGIFYFRWPLPPLPGERRATLRLSLATRCPKRAREMARHLSSCGLALANRHEMRTMRHAEIREHIRAYYQSILDKQINWAEQNGMPSDKRIEALKQDVSFAEEQTEHYWDLLDPETGGLEFLPQFCAKAGLLPNVAETKSALLLEEIKLARRDQTKAFLAFLDTLRSYEFSTGRKPEAETAIIREPKKESGILLSAAVREYLEENRLADSWATRTAEGKRSELALISEVLGTEKPIADVTKTDANDVKRTLQQLPKHRNKLPETMGLSMKDAIAMPGLEKVAPTTVNKALTTISTFFAWAERNGHVEKNMFDGMRVGRGGKKAVTPRKAFSEQQMLTIYRELTENGKGLVRSEDHKWATLIAMFTGARKNEVCQMIGSDIIQVQGVWCFSINDEGDGKSLKTDAATRMVPIHDTLIELGVLQLADKQGDRSKRIFDYTPHKAEGYGRNLGRWFNNSFIFRLGIKSKELVFHSFRHTMITRLGQAGVAEPIIKAIVGHERTGVTQQVYFKEGYTVPQLREALNSFGIAG